MNLTEQTVLLVVAENLRKTKNLNGETFEIDNDVKYIGMEAAIEMIIKLCSLPLTEEILPEINPKTGLSL